MASGPETLLYHDQGFRGEHRGKSRLEYRGCRRCGFVFGGDSEVRWTAAAPPSQCCTTLAPPSPQWTPGSGWRHSRRRRRRGASPTPPPQGSFAPPSQGRAPTRCLEHFSSGAASVGVRCRARQQGRIASGAGRQRD
nr:unnamed protein product [Digitaria exilis]